jgi:glycosyltransferase involved in cell wall biosynthesis
VRILFEAYWWVNGPQSNRAVLRDIVKTWNEEFPDDELILAVPQADVQTAEEELGVGYTIVGMRLSPHGVAAILEIPLLAHRLSADFSVSQNFTPFAGASAVLIQDVLFQTNPKWFTRLERFYFSMMPLSARRARVILASSNNEASRIAAANPRLKTPLVIGLAVNRELVSTEQSPPAFQVRPFTFWLTVGRLNVRKNLEFAITAALRSGVLSRECPLIVVGERDGIGVVFSDEIGIARSQGLVLFSGFLAEAELAWLYQNASCVLFLSLDEGFGLPAIEALWFGAPLVASDIPVFREVCGTDAIYTSPLDLDRATRAIRQVIPRITSADDQERRNRVAARYSWGAVVRNMRDAIEVEALSHE